MELDVDEGGFGPGLTGTVHSSCGIYEQGWQHIQNPNNVSRVALDRTKKHIFGVSYDPRSQSVTWWVDGAKQMSAGSPYVPEVGAKQNFYLIISAQTHGKQKPYSLFVGGVRAYVPPNSALPACQSGTQTEVLPEGWDSATLAAAIRRSTAGTTIRLPEGTFELTESVRPKSGIKLIGAGQDKTVLVYSGDKPDPFISLTDCEDVEIAHLTIDGRLRPLGQDGIRAGNCRKLRLHHLTIRDLVKGKSPFVHGIIFSGHNPTMERGVTDCVISDCRIENIGVGAEYGGGIRMAWGSIRNRVERNVIRTTGRGGIFGDHSAELVIRHNQVSGSGGEGLGIEIWGGCPRSLIEDNVVDHWISVDQGNQSAVRRNVVGRRGRFPQGLRHRNHRPRRHRHRQPRQTRGGHRPFGLEQATEEQRVLGIQHDPGLYPVGSAASGRDRRYRSPVLLSLQFREDGPGRSPHPLRPEWKWLPFQRFQPRTGLRGMWLPGQRRLWGPVRRAECGRDDFPALRVRQQQPGTGDRPFRREDDRVPGLHGRRTAADQGLRRCTARGGFPHAVGDSRRHLRVLRRRVQTRGRRDRRAAVGLQPRHRRDCG